MLLAYKKNIHTEINICSICSLLLLFSHSVMSDSLWPHGLQHTRLPCPSLSPRACSNSCQLSQWHHPTISSFVTPFSSCPQSFPASGSFPMSQLFTSSGQRIGASASVLPMNIQGWFPLVLTGLIITSGTASINCKSPLLTRRMLLLCHVEANN